MLGSWRRVDGIASSAGKPSIGAFEENLFVSKWMWNSLQREAEVSLLKFNNGDNSF